jgi:signal peptidase I
MAPTLMPEDHLLTRPGTVRRGDVIAFERGADVVSIKRVVGIPGDRVRYADGRLVLNGAVVQREALGPTHVTFADRLMAAMRYRETLPNEQGLRPRRYEIIEQSDSGPLDNTIEFTVPTGRVFVLGDNRDNSLDSRVSNVIGMVAMDAVVGRAWLILRSPTPGRAGQWIN